MGKDETFQCDLRGHLSFMILWLLTKKPMHGKELAEEIGKRKGEIPTAGTIYPALKLLHEKGLIDSVKEGKIIVYHLTPTGKKAFYEAVVRFERAFGEILNSIRKA